MDSRKIIALTGLSGAGKSTLLRSLQTHRKFTRLSASDVLKARFATSDYAPTAEELRLGDIARNQVELVEGFREQADAITGDIVFDCHTLIDSTSGLQFIPVSVFRQIGITDIVVLTVDPVELVKRRTEDHARVRPKRTSTELAKHQELAIDAARLIARELGVGFTDISHSPERILGALLTKV